MSLNDPLAVTLSNIWNAEKIGKTECIAKPASKIIKNVLDLMKKNQYIKKYEVIDDNKGGIIKITLIGKINKCGVIKPRFAIKKTEFEKYEKRFLPAKDFGILIISTPKGIITHNEAKEKKTGGRLLAFVY